MLNLGCGTKMNWSWTNLDFNLNAYFAHHRIIAKILRQIRILSEARYKRLLGVDPQIIRWDLSKGIPFEDNSFDVIYNSHVMEHIDLHAVLLFLKEIYRVLKKGGIVRIVVPDLKILINHYVSSAQKLENGDMSALENHQENIYQLFYQMVRTECAGASQQTAFVRAVENIVRGGPSKTGELHRWMYDKYTLGSLLNNAGFRDVCECGYNSSTIEGWSQFNLDTNDDGTAYKPFSLYFEGVK